MLHTIAKQRAGAQAAAMAKVVETCVHCGFCLATCPTYLELGEEMNSPRGRIILMKQTLEGTLTAEAAKPFIDRCLGCLACETSCPSGVRYGELITPYRAWAEPQRTRSWSERITRKALLGTLPYPSRFRAAMTAARLVSPLRRWMPSVLRAKLELVPGRLAPKFDLPVKFPANGRRRARVALLAGCAQQVLEPTINAATLRVLAANGVETIVPRAQGCCGALAMHIGEDAAARACARQNLDAFPEDVDAIVTNAAGCGSGLHEYPRLFRGLSEETRARLFAERVLDISVFLDRIGFVPPSPLRAEKKVVYHDACHLAHAQGVRAAPRRLLAAVPKLCLVEPAEWELCCGSAGTYNIEQPEIATRLGRRKAENLLATGAEIIVTGNIGCLAQIKSHLRQLGRPLPILHTIELLDRAYRDDWTGMA